MKESVPALLVMPDTACFDVTYAVFPGNPAYELAEATLTIEPRPISRVPFRLLMVRGSCAAIALDMARTQIKTPLTLTLITVSKSSIEHSDMGT